MELKIDTKETAVDVQYKSTGLYHTFSVQTCVQLHLYTKPYCKHVSKNCHSLALPPPGLRLLTRVDDPFDDLCDLTFEERVQHFDDEQQAGAQHHQRAG